MADNKLVDFLRSLKVTYSAYNLLHPSQLAHNKAPYKNAGLRKALFQSISSKDFMGLPVGDIPWMDKDVSYEEVKQKLRAERSEYISTNKEHNKERISTNFTDDVKEQILCLERKRVHGVKELFYASGCRFHQ